MVMMMSQTGVLKTLQSLVKANIDIENLVIYGFRYLPNTRSPLEQVPLSKPQSFEGSVEPVELVLTRPLP